MQRFEVKTTPLAGVFVLKAKPIGDERGYFERLFCAEEFKELGFDIPVSQINHSYNQGIGIIRGMHMQLPPYTEIKVVRCLRGKVCDVALDVRKNSPTFLQHFAVELSADEHNYLYLPHGIAHGYQALTEESDVLYLVSAPYHAEAEKGFNPLDPTFNIKWPLPPSIMSAKDRERAFINPDFQGIEL